MKLADILGIQKFHNILEFMRRYKIRQMLCWWTNKLLSLTHIGSIASTTVNSPNYIIRSNITIYSHLTNTIVFANPTAINRDNIRLCNIIITQVTLFTYVIFSSSNAHCQQSMSVHANSGTKKVEMISIGGREDNDSNNFDLLETSYTFVMQDNFSFFLSFFLYLFINIFI